MKKTLLLACTVLAAYTMKAGDLNTTRGGGSDDKKIVIGISVGAGIPMGAYGNKSTDTTDSPSDSTHVLHGYASTGFHFDVNFGYKFNSMVGAMIYIGGNMNSFDVSTYESVNNRHPASGETFSVSSYYAGQYLVGPFLSLGSSDKLKINLRLLLGLVTVNRPTETDNFTGGSFESKGNGGSGFGYQFGAGVQYNMNDALGLTFNLAYTGSIIGYTGYTQTSTFGSTTNTYTNTTLKQTMSFGMLNATVGVAINL